MSNQNHQHRQKLTAEDIEVRIWGFVVVAVTMILCFIVVALLYSVTFVVQPIKSMAPIDMAYTKMLNDIVLLIVGGIGGVIGKKGVGAVAQAMTPAPTTTTTTVTSSTPVVQQPVQQGFNWMGFQNPALDETWTPPPPPTTPPTLQEPDHEREALALARKEAE
ncbi:hypothetical protein UFOVP133_59 [uncultured Caudovirales phage]|uniref:Uncharacterized protein n=1 Tax=uncultured Caudovirales phage TaxID=2100421 RepID=A0A6J5LDP6_9CAUD|nr:hypothetical protein UFOVP133_59 [uncultured Caudovirales phage]